MSLRATLWALYDAPVAEQGPLLVLIALADSAADDGTGACVAQSTLAQAARCSTRSVRRYVAELVDAGLITVGNQAAVRHIRRDRRPTVYDLQLRPNRTPERADNLSTRESERADTAVRPSPPRPDNGWTTGGHCCPGTESVSPYSEELASHALGRVADASEQASTPADTEVNPTPPVPDGPSGSSHTVSDDPASIAELREALVAEGLGAVRFDGLSAAEVDQIARDVELHSTRGLVRAAAHAARSHPAGPPAHVRAWLGLWAQLHAPRLRPAASHCDAGPPGTIASSAAIAEMRRRTRSGERVES